jgi:hypothetical protein
VASEKRALILDIDSSSLGACIVEFQEKPVLVDVKRMPLGTGTNREPEALIPQLREALGAVIPSYAKKHLGITDVFVVAASPWFAATLRTLASKSERPVRVSRSSIQRIVSDHRKTEHDAAGHAALEVLPVTVLVNGYRSMVSKPVMGTALAVTLYESFSDTSFVQTVTDAVRSSLGKARISWHTTPLAYTETLLRLSDEDHATVVDVGGEVTDVVVLSHQTVAFVGSIPIGSRTIARALQGTGGLADSMSRLSLFARGELAEKEMQATAAALTTASAEWQKQFAAALDQAGNSVPVPHRVFVVGERDELPWFTQVLMGTSVRGQRPLPTVVNADYFAGTVTFGDGGVFDASLVLDALFFHMRGGRLKTDWPTAPVLYSVQ